MKKNVYKAKTSNVIFMLSIQVTIVYIILSIVFSILKLFFAFNFIYDFRDFIYLLGGNELTLILLDLTILTIIFLYVYLRKKIVIIVKNDELKVISKNNQEEFYNFSNHTFVFDSNSINFYGHPIWTNYVLKIIDSHGDVSEIKCYAFTKKIINDLQEKIKMIEKGEM